MAIKDLLIEKCWLCLGKGYIVTCGGRFLCPCDLYAQTANGTMISEADK